MYWFYNYVQGVYVVVLKTSKIDYSIALKNIKIAFKSLKIALKSNNVSL